VSYDPSYNGLVESCDEGARLAAVMGTRRLLFHRSHGVIVTAPTVAAAFDDLYYLERAAQVQLLAMSAGAGLAEIDPATCAATKERFDRGKRKEAHLHFEALKRTHCLRSLDLFKKDGKSGWYK
jgi:ribulose-5-phosphate 4-epimerase/fuculose-1-phosphate aldolase